MAEIDQVREYWNRRPCNAGHSRLQPGTREYFNQVEQKKYFVEPHIRSFADFPRWAGKRVLEIGCGIGTDTINFARAGAQVTAVDLSTESLNLAAKRAALFGVQDRITFHEADAENLSAVVPVERYDLVYSWGVVHHTPDPEQAMVEAGKYLGRLSELRVMVYASCSWKAAMIEAGLDQFEAQAGCPVARTFSDIELRGILPPLSTVRIWQDHIFPWDIGAYIEGRYQLAPWFVSMPPKLMPELERMFGWHLLMKGIA